MPYGGFLPDFPAEGAPVPLLIFLIITEDPEELKQYMETIPLLCRRRRQHEKYPFATGTMPTKKRNQHFG